MTDEDARATGTPEPDPEVAGTPEATPPVDDDTEPIAREELASSPGPPGNEPAFGGAPMWTDADRDYAAGPLPLEHEGFTRQIETGVLTGARWVDRFQSSFAPVAFAYAVFKKYADDEGSRLAALMAYYTFLSLFPLVIGGVALMSQVLENRPDLVQEVVEDVVPEAYQEQIMSAYHALPASGAALWVALIGLLVAGTGGVFALYATVNQVFAVPYRFRYGFGPRYIRVIIVIFIMAFAVLTLGVSSSVVGSLFEIQGANRIAVWAASSVVFSGAIYISIRILSRRDLRPRELLLGAVLGGVWVSSISAIGSLLVGRFISSTTPIYGAFGSAIAILSVMILAANGMVICLEISIVRAWQLWPRGIDIHLLFPADERSYALLTYMDERMPSQRNDLRFDADGHFDARRVPIEQLNRRQPGLPRSPYEDLQDSENSTAE